MSDPETSVTILEQLSRMGVIVSVDDFGNRLFQHELSAAIPDRQN